MGKKKDKRKTKRRFGGGTRNRRNRGGFVYGWEQRMCADFLDEGPWLREQMYDFIEEIDDYYMDNWRWCLVGHHEQEEKYRRKEGTGCCGFANKKVTHHKSKKVYRIGFNYGH